jgi:nicotinate dehydrogenase subunit A
MTVVTFQLNGQAKTLTVDDPAMPLLYALRNDFELHGPRYGCGLGQCGACTVHLDGVAVRSCLVPVQSVNGKTITTLEGLGQGDTLHALQKAFIEEQALQCGYCTNGMIMQAADLLKRTPQPTEDQVREALDANLCRCGSHARVVRAVLRASGQPTLGGA